MAGPITMANDNGGSDFEQTADKYALLLVPDYDVATGTQTSYLSLGATPPSASATAGASDWSKFESATVGARQHTDGNSVETTRGRELAIIGGNYEVHVRGSSAPSAYGTKDEQTTFRDADQTYLHLGVRAEIAGNTSIWPPPHLPAYLKLDEDAQKKTEIEEAIRIMKERTENDVKVPFTWEDHTAGHRISTTGGDKIEIIRGKNYTHVLGADDFDVAEGQLQIARTGPNPASWGGAVPATDAEAKKPYLVERTWAKRSFSETWLGTSRDTPASKLGLDAEIPRDENAAVVADGESVEYTYAKKLKSYTGASDSKVEEIYEETWADKTTSKSNVGTVDEQSTIGLQTSITTFSGPCTDISAGTVNTEISAFASHNELEADGAHIELEASGTHLEFNFCALHLELELSSHIEIDIGEKVEIKGACKELTTVKDQYILKYGGMALKSAWTAISHKITAASTSIGSP